jgi:hypothetical protein
MIFAPLLNKTEEEIFQIIYRHFLKQRCRSVSWQYRPNCHYRHPVDPNIKCAIGALISDEDYNINMERKSVSRLIAAEIGTTLFEGFPLEYARLHAFLSQMQTIHDDAVDYDSMMQSYADYAKKRNFTLPTLENA